ncbi:ATP-binding protein [Kibdelosporangium persicum]|uniref:DNA mismatch repair protein MutL n=1 Tax=Kibdelosporangium persicum TaxID=2698649 RepID=A0ABX2FI08_9PSEU|nr:ATP-binding protein [Kibdelosporangium persicum]NRN71048.1 DNA mismatch repair protein MutL [Kibdelosporangium persicum]
MPEMVLATSDDLVGRLAHEGDPVRAVVELVWNSIDAEGTDVLVVLQRDSSEAIIATKVIDDGHGVAAEEVEQTFGRIGDSWKKTSQRSKNGKRQLHGKLGEGRLRAFALGSHVAWESRCANTAGVMQLVTIIGDRSDRHRVHWEVAPAPGEKSGTTVTISNQEQRSLGVLQSDIATMTLRSHFAPVLLNDPELSITYEGVPLDPQREILRDTPIEVEFEDKSATHRCQVRIIEWRSGKHRALYFGPDEHHFVYEEPGSDVEGQYPYSAYITWDGLTSERLDVLSLGDMAGSPVSDLWKAARQAIREYFVGRRRERRREQVDQWKSTGVYPYKGAPKTEPERIERAVFDVVSGTLVPHISKRRDDARLTLALLRDALRHEPDKLTTIIHEFVALKPEDRDALTSLLSETTMSAIIRSANLVTSRHKFLVGLEHLLFDPDDSSEVGERDHLHKILERELWIFGEGYHLMSSERGLTELVRTHLRLEGLPVKGVEPVKRWSGKTGRVDLHLATRYREHDRVRHLVVELKAPDVTIKRAELDQVEDYANTVLANPVFASEQSHWDFVLVGTDLHELVENRLKPGEMGCFLDPEQKPGRPKVRAHVRRWRDLIDENKRRLEFVTQALEHDPSISEGFDHVKREYADLLPPSFTQEGDADAG